MAETPTVEQEHFNPKAVMPCGLKRSHVHDAMNTFLDFLDFLNQQLATRNLLPLESMLMPANFSSIVGEFVAAAIPRYCKGLVKNQYHNGHPDLIPTGKYKNNKSQYGHEGIEIKGSRYLKGWQGHNAEESFLMVFCYESGRPSDQSNGVQPKPFRFLLVCGAQLDRDDWTFAGRSETSRRTITAAVNGRGYEKMMQNWIYRTPGKVADTLRQ